MNSNEGQPDGPRMNTRAKENLLDRMRNAHQSAERNRIARSEREVPAPVRRSQQSFEDLPEYKQVLTQQQQASSSASPIPSTVPTRRRPARRR